MYLANTNKTETYLGSYLKNSYYCPTNYEHNLSKYQKQNNLSHFAKNIRTFFAYNMVILIYISNNSEINSNQYLKSYGWRNLQKLLDQSVSKLDSQLAWLISVCLSKV